jgi:CheY-like chemotaxis protein
VKEGEREIGLRGLAGLPCVLDLPRDVATLDSRSMENCRVLHVEDDSNDAYLVRRAVLKAFPAISLKHVHSGEEALAYLAAEPPYSDRTGNPLPDIILLDLKMDGLGGFDVLRWVRGHHTLSSLPVVILTSSDARADRELARQLLATAYVVKDFSYAEVIDFLREWMARSVCSPALDRTFRGSRPDSPSKAG